MKNLPGLLFTFVIAVISINLASLSFVKNTINLSGLVIAILLGIIIGNTVKINDSLKPGITFSLKKLLRLAIILLGFKLTFQNVAKIGLQGLIIDTNMVISTFIFCVFICKKVFKIEDELTYLFASGCSICGASAILATAPLVKSENHHTAVALGTITLFGTLSMFIYPILYKLGLLFGLTEIDYGIFTGASIHEVAQVVTAGFAVSDIAGNTATITKLTRVIMLAPVLIGLSFYLNKQGEDSWSAIKKIQLPLFVFGFVAMIGINSLNIIPKYIVDIIIQIDVYLFVIAMSAMGVETNINKIRKVGLKPIYSNTVISLYLFFAGLLVTKFIKFII